MNKETLNTLEGLKHLKGINAKEYAALESAVNELGNMRSTISSDALSDESGFDVDMLPDYYRGFCNGIDYFKELLFGDYAAISGDNRITLLILQDIDNIGNDIYEECVSTFIAETPADYKEKILKKVKAGEHEIIPPANWYRSDDNSIADD